MSEHTPGPWHMALDVDEYGYEVEYPPYFIVPTITRECTMRGQPETGITIARTEDEFSPGVELANARLVAAAPELLDVCRRALPLLRGTPLRDDVVQAIAKAEGEVIACG